MKNRSIVMVIVLTLVTCGIYGFYWIYDTISSMEQTSGQEATVSAVVALLLCIFVAPVGFILAGLVFDEQLNMIKAQLGIPKADNKAMYMILGFFIPIVMMALVQDEVNKLQPAV